MTIVVVVQARMKSTRLPNKIVLDLCGQPLLIRQLERIKASTIKFRLVVATTTDKSDDKVVAICKKNNMDVFRGHPTDCLDRHYQIGKKYQADLIVKIPSDCPLIDPKIIDQVVHFFLNSQNSYDYVSNLHPPTFPDGNDVEIMTMNSLELAWKEATKDYEREHTTPFLWEQPERFRLGNVRWDSGKNYAMSHRMTIDYPEDYQLINVIYEKLYSKQQPIFSLEQILNLLDTNPHYYEINKKYVGVNWYRHHLTELKTISSDETNTNY